MKKIGIIGLGYVGLPLAVEIAKSSTVVGFDINAGRISELKSGKDRTLEVSDENLRSVEIEYSSDAKSLHGCEVFIVTVPTPVSSSKQPDLTPLVKASETVSKALSKGSIVIYESTVFPGCTEEICVPILETGSGLKYNQDFFCGYSPERINPGDKERTVTQIKKVVSGSNAETLNKIDELYSSVITAGTFRASSIKVAEAAKVIENTQRDINIAFVNELSLIFDRLGLDTKEVLEAAGTKWNFLKFTPGLVGGHCIGVDPYYLTHKAESVGYHPQVILSGRRINDSMGLHVAHQVVKHMSRKSISVSGAKVLILGMTFKENCPDIRNSKVIDIINELKEFSCDVDVYDPYAMDEELEHEYGLRSVSSDQLSKLSEYSAVVLAVAHEKFRNLDWAKIRKQDTVVFDVKGLLDKSLVDGRL